MLRILIIIFFAFPLSSQAQTVVPFLKTNGKYILVDSATMKPIPNTKEFDVADELPHTLWSLGIKNTGSTSNILYALFNKYGKALTNFKFDGLYGYSGHKKFVEFKLHEKYGLLDTLGKEVTEAIYDEIELQINNDIHLVKIAEKYGYINNAGKQVIACIYEEANNFSDGWTLVSKGEQKNGFKLRYYIDKTGKTVLTPKQSKVQRLGDFSEGLAKIQIDKDGLYGFIDKTGKMVIKPNFKGVYSFESGMCQYAVGNDEYGFIDRTGKIIAPAKYSAVESLKQGFFIVEQNGLSGIINKKGNIIVPLKYDYLSLYNNNLLLAKQNVTFTIIDKKGKLISTLKNSYHIALGNNNNLITVSNDGKYGIIDANENIIVPIEYGVYGLSIKKYIQAINPNNKQVTYFDKNGRQYIEK